MTDNAGLPPKASFLKPRALMSAQTITFVFIVAMIILFGNTYILYSNMEKVRGHQAEIVSSNSFIEQLEMLMSKLKDIETGQRGYTLTADERFLEPYYQGMQTIDEHLRQLKDMKKSDPFLQEKLAEFEKLIREMISYQEGIVAQVRQQRLELARQGVASGRGREIMDRIRAAVSNMRSIENSLLSSRSLEAEKSAQRVDRLFIFVALTTLMLGLATYLLIFRNVTQQARENKRLADEAWVKTGLTQLNELLRGTQTVEGIAQKTLDFFSRYIEAQAGAFYILRGSRLEAMAALSPSHLPIQARPALELGETLTGEAFRQKRVLRLEVAGHSLRKISSGLIEFPIQDLVVAPLSSEDEAVGVIEMGTVSAFDPLDLRLIESAMQGIAISLHTAVTRSALQDLLEETQRQSEELQTQQEELRISNEELENQTMMLRSSQDKLQQQQEELRQINEELEQQTQALEAQSAMLQARNESLEATQSELEEKAEALESASRYKSEFLANMSHELRTPLNSLLILSTLLAENKEGNLNVKQIDFARTIYKSGNDLLALINDILDLSKVEAGKLQLHPEDFELALLAEELEREFSHLAEDKSIGFSIDIDPSLAGPFRSDKQRVEQILKNLLSNAIKFTSQGKVCLAMRRGSGELPIALSVSDTGIGIPLDKQELIFEAFEQVDRSTSRAYGGTGLGLTISRELATLLGGRISIESQAGEGSTFTLQLPTLMPEAAKTQASSEAPTAQTATPVQTILASASVRREAEPLPTEGIPEEGFKAGDRLVLIVEDDGAFGKSLVEVAREAGFKPFVATSGEGALDIVQKYNFSAILLDIKLPDISGFGVLERLKANQKTRHIPIHIVSGVDYSQNALNLGAVGYLLKPAAKSQLEKVFKHLEDIISRQVKRVLVVEDDVIQREAINHLLAGNDIELVGASSAREAIDHLGRSNFDCMILDLRLPDLSGFQLLEKLEASQDISRPPVIVYTGQDLSQEEIERLRQYSESIVIKGVRSPERLFDEVSLFLHRVETQLPPNRQELLEKLRSGSDPLVGRRVLVVDDDMRNVFAMANALNTHGMKVVVAKNGLEALDKIEQDAEIELVLMDIMMPVMDGYEAMQKIRENPKFKRLPIIALTAKAMKGDHEKCLKAGANDYLPKPVNLERLLSLMRVWLPRRHEV